MSVGQYIIKQNFSKIKYFTRKKLSEKNEHKTIIILDTKNKQINTNKNTKHAQNEIKFTQK